MQIRDEQLADFEDIQSLLTHAFPGEPVGQLVDDLRDEGDLLISLVATDQDRVVGHIGFSPVAIAPGPVRVAQLSPLAVASTHRRQGIGAALVRAGLDRCRTVGFDAVLILGDPAYYQRFGFDPGSSAHLRGRWAGPHFMGLELTSGSLASCTFSALAPAFERLP